MDRKNWNIGQPLWGQWTTLNAHHSSKSQTKPWCRCLDNVLPIYHLYISPDTREWQESNIVLERDTRRVIYPPHKKPSKPWSRGGGLPDCSLLRRVFWESSFDDHHDDDHDGGSLSESERSWRVRCDNYSGPGPSSFPQETGSAKPLQVTLSPGGGVLRLFFRIKFWWSWL